MTANKKRVFCIFGTRPESIKLFPVVQELHRSKSFSAVAVCVHQQADLLKHTLKFFNETPLIEVPCDRKAGDLIELTNILLAKFGELLSSEQPDLILVQGDTSTAFCASLAAFYLGIPLGHIEAGLRTFEPDNPYPEEAHRSMITNLARWHFCPSSIAYENILKAGIDSKNVLMCGNTVIDALQTIEVDVGLEKDTIENTAQYFVITVHRRENRVHVPGTFEQLIIALLNKFPSHDVVWVTHPSWTTDMINSVLPNEKRLIKQPPLSYEQFISLIKDAALVLTDSGGVQEEITSLGVPGIILREITDRPESLNLDYIKVLGWSVEQIVQGAYELVESQSKQKHAASQLFGDGNASGRIVSFLENLYRG
jgi:UDP-N-acetylglucosamine 2-epimerase (non-hydrolysing)